MKFKFAFLLILVSFNSVADPIRKIAIWDNTSRTKEGKEHLYSLQHLIKVAGIPAINTEVFDEALTYNVIITSSYLTTGILKASEITKLNTYLNAGGTIIAPQVRDPALNQIFGVSATSAGVTSHYKMNWNLPTNSYYSWLDEPEEKQISFAKNDGITPSIVTRSFTLGTATALASYEDGLVAATKNIRNNSGQAISLGFYWKDLVVKNQLDHDAHAERAYSNSFEPTTDTIAFFIRSVFNEKTPFSPFLHTSPGNSRATFMLTHDMDSTSGMVMIRPFSDYEVSKNIKATYNITVRYIRDVTMGAFYPPNLSEVKYARDAGHLIASHSVGHFPDFDDESHFPIGSIIDPITYTATCDGTNTLGGTVYGEVYLSKKRLDEDLGVTVRSFRSGYLAFNDKQINVEVAVGYDYDSSMSANDVLTNFPYRINPSRDMTLPPSRIYELPMTISDVFMSDPISELNYDQKRAIWTSVIAKNTQNSAPTMLLIHPNRTYKLTALQNFMNLIPPEIFSTTVDAFGDYWKARDGVVFSSNYTAATNKLEITLPATVNSQISFVIPKGSALSGVTVKDAAGNVLPFLQQSFNSTDTLMYQNPIPLLASKTTKQTRSIASEKTPQNNKSQKSRNQRSH